MGEQGNEKGLSAEKEPASAAEADARRSSGTDVQEVEWQYEAPDGIEKIEEWLVGGRDGSSEGAVGAGLAVARGSTKELTDTYYDTEDWRLYRAGYALRVRREASGKSSEATIKSLTPAGGAGGNLWRRREISEPLEGDGVDALGKATGLVGEHLEALVGARKVRPIFEVRTRRRVFDLLLDERIGDADGSAEDRTDGGSGIVQDASGDIRPARGGARVGEVALDSSEIPLGDGDEAASLMRVEVEVDASAADAAGLEGFVKAMEEALALRPTAISKYEAGLFATGQSPEGDSNLGSGFVDGSLRASRSSWRSARRRPGRRDREV